jgi:hypothetical protein
MGTATEVLDAHSLQGSVPPLSDRPAPVPQPQTGAGAALALQKTAGNRAVTDLVLLFRLRGKGFQCYERSPNPAAAAGYQWKFRKPSALLFLNGKQVGTHGDGPTWELDQDHSRVRGRKVAERPSPDPYAIDWLQLEAKSEGPPGMLSPVTLIKRVDTVGGKPYPGFKDPPAAASAGDSSGEPGLSVYYEANYEFYGPAA